MFKELLQKTGWIICLLQTQLPKNPIQRSLKSLRRSKRPIWKKTGSWPKSKPNSKCRLGKVPKGHGWSRPLGVSQVGSYIVILITLVVFYGFALPTFQIRIVEGLAGLAYFFVFLFLAYTAICLTLSDPTEENSKKTKYYRSRG